METLTLSTSVEQPDDDDGNKWIRKRKRFTDEATDDKVHLELEEKVKFRVEILNIICDNMIVQLEKRREKLGYIFDLFKGVFADEHDYSMKSDLNNISNVYSNGTEGKLYYDFP